MTQTPSAHLPFHLSVRYQSLASVCSAGRSLYVTQAPRKRALGHPVLFSSIALK